MKILGKLEIRNPLKMSTIKYHLKISGVHYAANPQCVAGQPDTEEMHVRTREMLRWVKEETPIVTLQADPTNPANPDAVMAMAEGTQIGYVGEDWLPIAKSLLAESDCQIVPAEVAEVEIVEHGWLWVMVETDELMQLQPLKSSEIEWQMWLSDQPLLPPSKQLLAEKDATFVLEKLLLPRINEVDIKKLKRYLDVWVEASRHDLSREAREKRSKYIELLEAAKSKEVRMLANPLKRQRTSICGRPMINARCQEWWPAMKASERVQRLWHQWLLHHDNCLWDGLRQIDAMLRQLPGELYHDIDRLDMMLSRPYYLNTPRQALQAILALLMLRELTCEKLGIAMKPMTEADYGQDKVV